MSSILSSATIWSRRPLGGPAPLAMFTAAILFATQALAAQQAQKPQSNSSSSTVGAPRHPTRPTAVKAPAREEEAAPAPQPEMPKWPVNDAPNKPSVTWDSSGLKIEANNSSLHDIMNQVSVDTGAKVEGLGADERVFGEYGPGNTRDVISQLLHGSSYNVLMIGDQGAGTPRQIVLSTRRSGGNQPHANASMSQDQPDEDIQPDQPDDNDQSNQQPMLNGRPPIPMVPQGPPGPPGAPRTPQQVLQELQQRQQQIQDQQQQQQQQQQPH